MRDIQIVKRVEKGSPLTNAETDANFEALRQGVVDSPTNAGDGATGMWDIDVIGTASNVREVVKVQQGGTGTNGLLGYVRANGTEAMSATLTIPGSDIIGNIAGSAAALSTSRNFSFVGAFTGFGSFNGSQDVIISTTRPNIVAPGTATKVTFNANGDITGTSTLLASDIPNLDFSKITTGRPTTLAGYGIFDALSTSSPVPITLGGTGATTASAALSALGAYPVSNPNGYTSNLGTVTSVSGVAPIVSSGGATPALSINPADAFTDGYLTKGDWSIFNNKQAALGYIPVNAATMGNANGGATLNAAGQLTTAQVPAFTGAINNAPGSLVTTLSNSGVSAGVYGDSSHSLTLTLGVDGRVTNASVTPTTVSFANVTARPTTAAGYGITDVVTTSQLGVANGVATLNASGVLPSNQLPSYVDDVLEFATRASFPAVGETGKIYLDLSATNTNQQFRWSGSTYVPIISSDVQSVAGRSGTIILSAPDINGLAASATIDTTNASNITSGTIAGARLPGLSGSVIVAPGSTVATLNQVAAAYTGGYGSPTLIPQFALAADGRITSATQVAISVSFSSLLGRPTTLAGYGITDSLTLGNVNGFAATTSGTVGVSTAAAHADHSHPVGNLNGLSDVTTATRITGDVLSWNGSSWGNATQASLTVGNATKLATPRTFTFSGDAVGSTSFDGSSNVNVTLTQPNTGITANTYGSATQLPVITFNAKGLATGVSLTTITPDFSSITNRPTTLAGYGITDAMGASGVISIANGGTGATTSAGALVSLGAYPASNPNGYTSNTGTVTSVAATGPLSSTGGDSPVISMPLANATTSGYISSTDWNTFNSKQNALGFTPVNSALLGVANGVATLDSNGQVPSAQLPSYVDDVLEYAALASFPAVGETGKIYVDTSTDAQYRWSGTAYRNINSGAVTAVAGRTGIIILTSADVGLGNVNNTSDANKPVSTAQATAISSAQTAAQAASTPIAHVGSGAAAHAAVSTTVNGFMLATDKVKLDGIQAGAQVNAVNTVAGRTGTIILTTADINGLAGSASVDTTNASNISSGTLPAARLPAFTGAITTTAGSTATTLSTTGVAAASYGSASQIPTFVVGADGRITSAGNNALAVAFSAVTARPTTLSGYGITDALTNAGANSITGVQTYSSGANNNFTQFVVNSGGSSTINRGGGNGETPRINITNNTTIAFSNWPAAGILGTMFIELVNAGSFATTLSGVSWVLPTTGAPAASFAAYLTAIGRTSLRASGSDWIFLWSSDGGVTINGKLL